MKPSGVSSLALAAGLIVFNIAAGLIVFLVAVPLLIPDGIDIPPQDLAAIRRDAAVIFFAFGTVFSFILAFGTRCLMRRGASLEGTLDALRQPCFILDENNAYVLINKEAERVLGISREQGVGGPAEPAVLAALAAASTGKDPNRGPVATLGGAGYRALDNPLPGRDADGRGGGRLVVLHSVDGELRVRDGLMDMAGAAASLGDDVRNIAESSLRLARDATSQDSAIASIASSLDEFSKRIRGNTESAAKGSQFAAQAREVAERSGGEIAYALSAMTEVQDVGVRIARIVKLIDDIAFQTNLLALNASVEAARAGRQGKGFAVVAEEVRSLAGRSARAAKDTASMVEDVTERIGNASSYMSRLEEMLRNIVQEAIRMADYSASAATTSADQAAAILQVAQDLSRINAATGGTRSAAEETSASVGDLESRVGALRRRLERFAFDMGSADSPASGSPRLYGDAPGMAALPQGGRHADRPPAFGASAVDDDFVEPFRKMAAAEEWNLSADSGSPLPDLLRSDGYAAGYDAFLRSGEGAPLPPDDAAQGGFSHLADGPAEYRTTIEGDRVARPEQKIHLDDREFGRY